MPPETFEHLRQQAILIPFCPEVAAGCPAPRPPCEMVGGNGGDVLNGKAVVINREGADLTAAFIEGARKALQVARENGVTAAILKEGSPSCGSSLIYDGAFSGKRIPGRGVTAALLQQNGVKLFSEVDLPQIPTVVGLEHETLHHRAQRPPH